MSAVIQFEEATFPAAGKVRIALARGKKQYDKRESLKAKDAKREMDRFMKK